MKNRELAMQVSLLMQEDAKMAEQLEALEDRDGEKWRAAAGYVLTVVLGIVIGFVFKQFGM